MRVRAALGVEAGGGLEVDRHVGGGGWVLGFLVFFFWFFFGCCGGLYGL